MESKNIKLHLKEYRVGGSRGNGYKSGLRTVVGQERGFQGGKGGVGAWGIAHLLEILNHQSQVAHN